MTILALASLVGFLARNEPGILPRGLAAVMVLGAVVLLIDQHTRIDSGAGTVAPEGRLPGGFRVWCRRHPLSGFTSVVWRRHYNLESGDTVFVGLRRRSGRPLWVSYFSAARNQSSLEAEQVVRSLAARTGLPLEEEAI